MPNLRVRLCIAFCKAEITRAIINKSTTALVKADHHTVPLWPSSGAESDEGRASGQTADWHARARSARREEMASRAPIYLMFSIGGGGEANSQVVSIPSCVHSIESQVARFFSASARGGLSPSASRFAPRALDKEGCFCSTNTTDNYRRRTIAM